jgi:ArsR family transcriptional regulator
MVSSLECPHSGQVMIDLSRTNLIACDIIKELRKIQKCCKFVRYITNIVKKEEVLTMDQKILARFAKAMGHPIRMYVLELLSKQTCCYSGDLTEVLPIAKSTLSQHLKELKDAGLIQGETEAPKIKYCLNQENWKLAQQLFDRLFKR